MAQSLIDQPVSSVIDQSTPPLSFNYRLIAPKPTLVPIVLPPSKPPTKIPKGIPNPHLNVWKDFKNNVGKEIGPYHETEIIDFLHLMDEKTKLVNFDLVQIKRRLGSCYKKETGSDFQKDFEGREK
jgi:hypothetical protein